MSPSSAERDAVFAATGAAARAPYISNDVIDQFLEASTPTQIAGRRAMLGAEVAHRDASRRARLLRQARLPVRKSVEDLGWAHVRFPDGWGRDDMLSLAFVGSCEDLVFFGQTGRGKSHMAIALSMRAAAAGIPVRSWQTAQLVLELGNAKRDGALAKVLGDMSRSRLLVLGEFGYVPFDADGARLLCQVISESYERRAIISTTNIGFSEWGTVFADDRLAQAIVDRVVHHGRLVEFAGPSHRLESSLTLGKGGAVA
jgi:DNA replication protein DnaC